MISELLEWGFSQSFGQHISQHFISRTIFHRYCLASNLFTNKMVRDIDMFGSTVTFWICWQFNCTLLFSYKTIGIFSFIPKSVTNLLSHIASWLAMFCLVQFLPWPSPGHPGGQQKCPCPASGQILCGKCPGAGQWEPTKYVVHCFKISGGTQKISYISNSFFKCCWFTPRNRRSTLRNIGI